MIMNKKSKLIGLILTFAVIGCDLDVNNPNSLLEDDLKDPSAASAVANGAWNAALRGVSYMMMPYTVAGDESVWIGSRDAWRQIDKGGMTNEYNEFVDQAWPYISEARWMADEAVTRLGEFNTAGTLPDVQDLVLAHLTAAMVRIYIADFFDDFVYSNKTVSGTPIGAANMHELYDQAMSLLTTAESIADASNKVKVLALKARVAHAEGIWGKLNPSVNTSSPYVSAGATEAAAAAALMSADYKWKMNFSASTVSNYMSGQINSRQEMDLLYNAAVGNGDTFPNDPVTGVADTRMQAEFDLFKNTANGTDYAPITIVSLREMHLIIAESKLAGGDNTGCLAELNAIRAFDGLAAYASSQDAAAAFKHERRANLFIQGRRLADMYRFGESSVVWDPVEQSAAGSFFPITIQEIRANPNINQ
tara:strand:- start:1461 stop:2720 length:1260 start_codon:yes stop_codon:yes gene_type:complete